MVNLYQISFKFLILKSSVSVSQSNATSDRDSYYVQLTSSATSKSGYGSDAYSAKSHVSIPAGSSSSATNYSSRKFSRSVFLLSKVSLLHAEKSVPNFARPGSSFFVALSGLWCHIDTNLFRMYQCLVAAHATEVPWGGADLFSCVAPLRPNIAE